MAKRNQNSASQNWRGGLAAGVAVGLAIIRSAFDPKQTLLRIALPLSSGPPTPASHATTPMPVSPHVSCFFRTIEPV